MSLYIFKIAAKGSVLDGQIFEVTSGDRLDANASARRYLLEVFKVSRREDVSAEDVSAEYVETYANRAEYLQARRSA